MEENQLKPTYFAVIPANVRYAKISANAKLLYGEITTLTNKKGYCWATNGYFAELYGVHKNTVSRWISELSGGGFIEIEIVEEEKNGSLLTKRVMGINEKLKGGINKKLKHNNTSINNTSNSKLDKSNLPEPAEQARQNLSDELKTFKPKASFTRRGKANPDIDAIEDLFKEKYKAPIPKVHRRYIKHLINRYGYKQSLEITRYVLANQDKPYFPVISSPRELWDKLSKVSNYIQNHDKRNGKGIIHV